MTTVPLQQYFTSAEFFRYFGNIVGDISYKLPGVFINNPVTNVVNISLWTLPAEFGCYLLMTAGMLTGVAYRRVPLTVVWVSAMALLAYRHFLYDDSAAPKGVFPVHVVIMYFATGAVFNVWRDAISARVSLFILCIVASLVTLHFNSLTYLTVLPLTYVTVFVGLLPVPRLALLRSGDYSYGIYIYAFPITQTLLAVWPNHFAYTGWSLILPAILFTTLFAALSWHGIERRALDMRYRLPKSWASSIPGNVRH